MSTIIQKLQWPLIWILIGGLLAWDLMGLLPAPSDPYPGQSGPTQIIINGRMQ